MHSCFDDWDDELFEEEVENVDGEGDTKSVFPGDIAAKEVNAAAQADLDIVVAERYV